MIRTRPAPPKLRAPAADRQVFVGSATQLPYPDRAFASVLSNCVLEHIPPLTESLAEIARVTKPGGKLVITVPSERFASSLFWPQVLDLIGQSDRADAYGRWFNGISRHYHTYTREEWTRRLEVAGFTVRRWTSYLSPDAMAFFDLSHYYGAPTLLTKRLTGRWIMWPGKRDYLPWERSLENRLAGYAKQIAVPDGAYYFFSAERNA